MAISKKKILAYVASGSALVGMTQSVEADLVFNSGNLAPGSVVNDTTLDLDLDNDGTLDVQFLHDADGGFSGTQYAVASVTGLGANMIGGAGIYAIAGASSTSASAGGSFINTGYLWDGAGFVGSQFTAGTTNFLAVQFDIAGSTHFGFVEVAISDDPNPNAGGLATSNVITIVNYAYEDVAGAAAHFEQPAAIPELGSLGLLALGASGIALMRRRKTV